MRETGRLISFLVAALSVGCGVNETDEAAYTIVDSAGVRIIQSHSPTWGESRRGINPDPLLRIGQVEGEEPYQFGRLTDGVLLSAGQIAVSDLLANEVRIFDSTGRHLKTFGRHGEGPGEFRRLIRLFAYSDDSLASFDQGLYRTTIFSRSSGLPRIVQNQVEGNFVVFGILSQGPLLLFNPGQFRRDLPQGLQWDSTDVVAMHQTGDSAWIVIRLPVLERLIGPGGSREALTPFGVSIQAVAEGGFYWATSDRYEITFYDIKGERRRILRRPIEPRAVDQSMIETYKTEFLAWVRRTQGEAAVPRYTRRFEEGVYGRTVPLFGTAFVDSDQRLWVSESVWPKLEGQPRRWSVFSAEGVWLGDLPAPEGLRIVDSHGDVVLGIWQDEMEVQYIQLHRIVSD